ncbi:MAG TPA: L,D-transpeptidase family protein [Flavobacterium sp.]|nr:L,D-transpeptidase family protein [Flavobacterium sp.]
MRKFVLYTILILFSFILTSVSFVKKDEVKLAKSYLDLSFSKLGEFKAGTFLNKQAINAFFKKYPKLSLYKSDVVQLYANKKYKFIWYENNQLTSFSELLYSKINSIEEEGLQLNIGYKEIIDGIFNSNLDVKKLSESETDIMISSMYVFYINEVFNGLDADKLKEIGWLLPKKKLVYESLLDSLLQQSELLSVNERIQTAQYYKLRKALKKYREIEKMQDWEPIEYDSTMNYKPLDNSNTIKQIRHRLMMMGDLSQDSKSTVYDEELIKAVLHFKKRNGYNNDPVITPWHIKKMNLPIEEYVRKIEINMERCRWFDPKLTQAPEYVMVNIPAFELIYNKNRETLLKSNIVVGQDMMETVIFNGYISSIVFSPYWYVPQSIIENEFKSKMKEDENFLSSRNMEWNNGQIRQKPGKDNALGLVKFVFPNTSSIYLHDTPMKALFDLEYRAFSHGCINMEKAKELAFLILKDDPDWPESRINEAMNGEIETPCQLKTRIPIYIGYFTVWVDDEEMIHFYDDIYERDIKLSSLLFKNSNN